jgi:hypothetical protein
MLQISNHPLYKRHDIDSAMNSFWAFYKSRFLVLFLTSFVMSLIIQYGTTFIGLKDLQSLSDPESMKDPMVILEKLKAFIVPMILLGVVSIFFSNILHYYILMKPLDDTKNIFVSILGSLKYFIPYLIILVILAFIGSFVIILGLLVFIIGVIFSLIYLMMISLFILPAMMSDGINIGNVISRTAKLSHRNFWNNIGWTSVFLILMVVVSLIFSSIVMIPFTGSFLKTIANPESVGQSLDFTTNPLYIILSSAVNAVTLPLIPIFGFILYFNGRAREEAVQSPVYGDSDYKVRVEDLYARPIEKDKIEDRDKEELKS